MRSQGLQAGGGYRVAAFPFNAATPLWRGYASIVGGIIIVAVWTADRRSAVISWPVISSRSSSADGGSTNCGGTDANRNARAYTTVVSAATIGTTTVDATACDTGAIG